MKKKIKEQKWYHKGTVKTMRGGRCQAWCHSQGCIGETKDSCDS